MGDLPPRSSLACAMGVAVATMRKVTPAPVLSALATAGGGTDSCGVSLSDGGDCPSEAMWVWVLAGTLFCV